MELYQADWDDLLHEDDGTVKKATKTRNGSNTVAVFVAVLYAYIKR